MGSHPGSGPSRQSPLTELAGTAHLRRNALGAIEAGRTALGASVTETLAALVVAADGWSGLDRAGEPPEPLDRDRVAALAGELARTVGDDIGDPSLLGAVHEHGHAAAERRRRGVHFTPHEVCLGLVDRALDGWDPPPNRPVRVLDPACGGGAFLRAAAVRLGSDVELRGIDLDPRAAWCTRLALRDHLGPVDVVVGDALAPGEHDVGAVDLVVGNPPFSAQLRRRTARTDEGRADARGRFGPLLGPYADGALAFLLDGIERVATGGRVALVLPWSVLASRDARGLRRHLADGVRHVWIGGPDVFPGALVHVCGLVVDTDGGAPSERIDRSWGPGFAPLAPASRTPSWTAGEWGDLLADALGVPTLDEELVVGWGAGPTVGDRAAVTAGFRDEYYGVTAVVRDLALDDAPAAADVPVVSVGMIEPLDLRWGRQSARMAGRAVERPVIRLADLASGERVARWVAARMVPKLVVATQTRVLEVAVDETGSVVPLTPVIAVEPTDPDELWHLAAALTGPVATALAWRRSAGTALSAGAIKVGAPGVRALPLPTNAEAWDRAARLARAVAAAPTADAWRRLARAHNAMFGVDDERLVAWWLDRLDPSSRRRLSQ